jgi:hypothetical protein
MTWFSVSVSGVQFVPLSIEELTDQADLVVHGRVEQMSCQRNDQGRICTSVTLHVSEVWKGAMEAQTLEVVLSGGVLGERRVAVSGQVEYEIGEEIVGFYVLNDRGQAVTIGLAQGKFHVGEETESPGKPVSNLFHGGERMTPESGMHSGKTLQSNDRNNRVLTLKELKGRVQGGVQ